MVKIPHRDDPGSPCAPGEWKRLYEPTVASSGTPDFWVTENPVVDVLLGPHGYPIRVWRERPPFGFQPGRAG